MNNELKNELKIELSCSNCSFTKVITVELDEDGVFTIPDKFCPRDLTELKRDVLRTVTKPEPKQDEPTENKTEPTNAVPKPARPVEVPKHGHNRSKRT